MRSRSVIHKVDKHQLVEVSVVVHGIGRVVRAVVGGVDDLGHVGLSKDLGDGYHRVEDGADGVFVVFSEIGGGCCGKQPTLR